MCYYAEQGGNIDCLRYAHGKGCKLQQKVILFAAIGGSVDCLRYARDNGCVWDSRVCFWAASDSRLECLKYALENGCPIDVITIWDAFHWSVGRQLGVRSLMHIWRLLKR